MPAAYALTSPRIFGPTVRCERTASSWFARKASVSALGTNAFPLKASASGSSPGTSSAAIRAGPRMSWRRSPRSAAVTQPAPKATSASVRPFTCATPNSSRKILTPARGFSRLYPALAGAPSGAGLNIRRMWFAVTLPKSGVSAS